MKLRPRRVPRLRSSRRTWSFAAVYGVTSCRGGDTRSPAQENKPAEKRKPDYEVYEEDDEFEEFAQDNWDAAAEDAEDPKLWQDDWDDDDVDDDFCRHLREELQKPVEKN